MKRAILLASIMLFIGSSTAIVGYNGSTDQPHILKTPSSGSSSQGGTSVGPNGTSDEWNANFRQINATCSGNQSEGIQNIEYSGEYAANGKKRVSWTGHVLTPNPCYTADLTAVEQLGNNSYRLNITTESSRGACIECVGAVTYEADFSTQGPFQIEVLHDGEQVETVNYPGYETGNSSEDPNQDDKGENSGPLSSLINWLRNIF